MIRGIDVVYIHTPHRELGQWYADTLGLERGYGDEHWQEFQMADGSRFAVDRTGFPRSAIEKQAVMISFRVEDLQAAVQELASRGVEFYPSREATIFDVGPALVATFQDPDGNWVQLSQRKQA
jgi:predicted enzyme related to lactoylglutathione lyase